MKNLLMALAVLILGALAYYFWVMRPAANEMELTPPTLIEQPAAVKPAAEMPAGLPSETQPSVPETEPLPLPALADSDPVVLDSVTGLVGETAVRQYVLTENIVARLVATIDALTGRQVSANLLPLNPPGGVLAVTEDAKPADAMTTPAGDPIRQFLLDPVSYQRYKSYVELLESVDTDLLIATYLRYEPLFQQAYVDLGYPQGNFNSRLLEVIDHVLDAPSAAEPIRLVKPEAYYLFADSQLEALTAGQKLMIRMGSGHAQRVKRRLAELRAALEAVSTTKQAF